MPADFSLVAHTAECYAHILATGCLGDGLSQGCFANARGADQAQNRSLHFINPLLHCEIFKNAVFDLV
ncbi:hypothetical protein GALL_445330 [mine drainage metagenome]|uniref:Uncharacterized protein n=1 Tax=mine drainage metagenome TaxID=410659 RepID=A0A1J5QCX3_9ZZZZ